MAGSQLVGTRKLVTLLVIDGDIQVPEGGSGRGRPSPYPWRDMKVGDSFFTLFPGVRGAVQYAQRKKYGRYTVRKRKEDGVVGFRVWRVA